MATSPSASTRLPVVPSPSQSGWMVVVLLLGSVYLPVAWASRVGAAGLPDVPLLVQPDSWSFVKVSVGPSGRETVDTRSAASYEIVTVWERGSVIWVSCP